MRKVHVGLLLGVFVFCTLIALYARWFSPGVLTASDFPYISSQRMSEFSLLPEGWSEQNGNGLGGHTFATVNLDTYVSFGIKMLVLVFGIPWSIVSRLLFFFPFLILGSVSSYLLARTVIGRSPYVVLSPLIYLSNTYIVMIATGGQVGIMMAYAIAPFVLVGIVLSRPYVVAASLFFLFLFDLRYAYIMVISIVVFSVFYVRKGSVSRILAWAVPLGLVVFASAYWLVPLLNAPSFGLPAGYGSVNWLSYLSWADFPHTISFLHPNWPENIFGKTYFLRPEYLLLPVIVFLPFLFDAPGFTSKKSSYTYWVTLLLVGAFLGKGVHGPFPGVYEWMYVHVPLFNGFRDPTKFYVLIAVSYSVLIPFVVHRLPKTAGRFASVFVCCYWIFLLLPLWLNRPVGTLSYAPVPSDYVQFERHIGADRAFSRVLAIPWKQRFLSFSSIHPVVNGSDLFASSDSDILLTHLADPSFEHTLSMYAVRYVVVPSDPYGEIFLTDRSYDASRRNAVIAALDRLPFLTRDNRYTDLAVYEFGKHVSHVYRILENGDYEEQKSTRIRSTRYAVEVETASRPIDIVFSESYDPAWKLWDGQTLLSGKKTKENTMVFSLPTRKTTSYYLLYTNESVLLYGYWISAFVLVGVGAVLLWRKKHQYGYGFVGIFVAISLVGVFWVRKGEPLRGTDMLSRTCFSYSSDWREVRDPLTAKKARHTIVGGSTIDGVLRFAKHVWIGVEGTNTTPDEQGIAVEVDGSQKRWIASPFSPLLYRVDLEGSQEASVHIYSVCSSAMVPCGIRITRLATDGTCLPSKNPILPTLAILGDSITSSYGQKNYSFLAGSLLHYRILNAGVFGSSVVSQPGWDSAALRLSSAVIPFSPEVVVLFVGTNDAGRQVPIDTFRLTYAKMVAEIRTALPRTKVLAVGLLNRFDLPVSARLMYSQTIADVAAAYDIPFVDPSGWLSKNEYQDAIHPSEDAQPMLARALVSTLKAYKLVEKQ